MRLLFVTFDPEVARFYGINTTRLEMAFSLLLAATIIAGLFDQPGCQRRHDAVVG